MIQKGGVQTEVLLGVSFSLPSFGAGGTDSLIGQLHVIAITDVFGQNELNQKEGSGY